MDIVDKVAIHYPPCKIVDNVDSVAVINQNDCILQNNCIIEDTH